MMTSVLSSFTFIVLIHIISFTNVFGRPMVRHIRSAHEFDRLLEKHASSTGLPVIADFYSDGCGPCRQIAPIFKKLAEKTGQENAVFVKINTQEVNELSARYQIRSIPTFFVFLNGKQVDTLNGASEYHLQMMIDSAVSKSQTENVVLSLDALVEYYKDVDASKAMDAISPLHQKCADLNKKYNPDKECIGSAATQLAKKLKDKYKKKPPLKERFTSEDRKPGNDSKTSSSSENSKNDSKSSSSSSRTTTASTSTKPNLHLATKEELMAELEKRLDEEEDARVEEEDDDESEFEHSWIPNGFPERVTIIGGGPAGMSAALYAARAGLKPLVVAPPMGGQLQGKGVDVENYPGLFNVTGPSIVSAMRNQAATFGAVFEADEVVKVDASTRPLKVYTNSTTIETHAIIVATGAESNWLGIPGEYEMRGGGVSSCATCDGHFFAGRNVVVVGGGDTAMEDALVLARTSKSVTVIHRRDEFRASKVLAQRVMEHPSIQIQWNSIVTEIIGKELHPEGDIEDVDLDNLQKTVTGVVLKNVVTNELSTISADAVFVAIGHTPTTSFLHNIVEFDENHPGYVKTMKPSTKTSVPGIFACGDVTDAIYRQAITSAGSGAAAALDAERWLSEEGLGNEEAEFEASLLAELLENSSSTSSGSYNTYEDTATSVKGVRESARVEL